MKRFWILAAIAIASTALYSPARAHAEEAQYETSPSADPALPGSVKIDNNWAFTRSVITGGGLTKPRTLNAYQSATFVQSWLAPAIYGKPQLSNPPASLPVFKVAVTGLWGSTRKSTYPVFYATQGKVVWIAFPAPIGSDSSTSPTTTPKPTKWFVPPDFAQVKGAFEGTAKLIATAGTAPVQVAPPTTVAPAPTSSSSSSSSTGWIILAVIAGLVVVAVVVMQMSRRRSSKAGPKPPAPSDKVGVSP